MVGWKQVCQNFVFGNLESALELGLNFHGNKPGFAPTPFFFEKLCI